jgi:hypothetical protein
VARQQAVAARQAEEEKERGPEWLRAAEAMLWKEPKQ